MRFASAVTISLAFLAGASMAQGFKFSNEDPNDKAREAEQQARVQALLASPCKAKIKNQKIMVLIGESSNGLLQTSQNLYGGHFDALNGRLQALGLKTFTQAQIRSQIAQAEIDAYFRNDPDGALAASKKHAANYVLRGLISTQAAYNTLARVNQVSVRMQFSLTDAKGKLLSQTSADNASYSGPDTVGLALTLIQEKADEVVAQLYSDYCRAAGS